MRPTVSVVSTMIGTEDCVASRLMSLVHVADAVGAGVVDADVQDVRALFDLVAPDADAGVPVAFQHRLTELLGAVRVGALAHQEHRAVLAGSDVGE